MPLCGYDNRTLFAAGHNNCFHAQIEQPSGEFERWRGIIGRQPEQDSSLAFVRGQHVYMRKHVGLQCLARCRIEDRHGLMFLPQFQSAGHRFQRRFELCHNDIAPSDVRLNRFHMMGLHQQVGPQVPHDPIVSRGQERYKTDPGITLWNSMNVFRRDSFALKEKLRHIGKSVVT